MTYSFYLTSDMARDLSNSEMKDDIEITKISFMDALCKLIHNAAVRGSKDLCVSLDLFKIVTTSAEAVFDLLDYVIVVLKGNGFRVSFSSKRVKLSTDPDGDQIYLMVRWS